jgi:hypothetical protein
MVQKLKTFWNSLNKNSYEKRLESAENLYELERMLRNASYVHNIKRWL